jgi:predicted O-linked N-acetylglucosamine transferase (SPINDLY family)
LLWAKVLRQVPKARLVLLAGPGSHRDRTGDYLAQEGIDKSRLEFAEPAPRRDYLQLYHRIDIVLDSFPYNGHSTSLDSFWMGVPVVTWIGPTPVSRAGWCQLSNLNLPELAGHSPEAFVGIACALAADRKRLAELRRTLRPRMEQSPLMNIEGFARNIEAAYRNMWELWCTSARG